MNEEAAEYIKKELEISRLRIESLSESTNLSEIARNRLLNIENDFQILNFESLAIKDLSDAMTAIRLFRSSRKDFYLIYKKDKTFLQRFKDYAQSTLSQEIPDKKGPEIKRLLKKRSIVFSALQIFEILESKLQKENLTAEDSIFTNFIKTYPNEFFVFYNQSLKETFSGKIQKDLKINYLINIVEDQKNISQTLFFQKFISHGKDTKGILLPIAHQGRETSWLCHKKIIINNVDFSDIFAYSLKNINQNGKYFKAIILKDIQELEKDKALSWKYSLLLNFLYQNSLSKKDTRVVNLDMEKSSILVPSSRTEDDLLKESWQSVLKELTEL